MLCTQATEDAEIRRSDGLRFKPLRGYPDYVPNPTEALERVDHQRRGITWKRPRPWTAEVGKAWWLLCQASPKVGIAIRARLRDRPCLVVAIAEDMAERVDAVGEVMEDEDPDQAAPEQGGESGDEGAADHPTEREGEQQADDRPEKEGPIDPVDRRVGDQIGGEALPAAALGVDEEPAEVGVEKSAQGAAEAVAMVDVGAVGAPSSSVKAWCLRWSATQEMTGPSIAAEPRMASRPCSQGLALKLRWVRWRWKPTVTPSPVKT